MYLGDLIYRNKINHNYDAHVGFLYLFYLSRNFVDFEKNFFLNFV